MDTRILSAQAQGAIDEAVRCLGAGGLVAVPTETVYGLAGDAMNGQAVARIFEAKGRPSFNPLIAHVCDLDMARQIAALDAVALALAERFWPGPLTLVLPLAASARVHPLVTAGLSTVAVRMPKGPASEIIRRLGRPLAAPSANRSGRVSPTTADHVNRSLGGRIELILDAGPCAFGLESTIVKPEGGELLLLRPGAVTVEEIEDAIGLPLRTASGSGIQAPGQMASHYAPAGQVRLEARHVEAGEHLVAFGSGRVEGEEKAASRIDLSPDGDLREAAANLFAALARLDAPDVERIAVMPIPRHGLGLAINDRLARAAAPR
ncbi:L-threonylcarbamoyladenylate synthase [Aureimonas populi]|uniref:Threonylcarbamoyl-AMP synthase n=1 Tax=Aureimonas populi TaxID=1701758 RepID=A0ABW5CM05_9HYPH|nr:L-threonylcarbamoyladenylate synthase [Aureimonas populi]